MKIKFIKNLDLFGIKKGEIYDAFIYDYLLTDVLGQSFGEEPLKIPFYALIKKKYAIEIKD